MNRGRGWPRGGGPRGGGPRGGGPRGGGPRGHGPRPYFPMRPIGGPYNNSNMPPTMQGPYYFDDPVGRFPPPHHNPPIPIHTGPPRMFFMGGPRQYGGPMSQGPFRMSPHSSQHLHSGFVQRQFRRGTGPSMMPRGDPQPLRQRERKQKRGGEGAKYQGIKMIRSDGEFHCDPCDRNYETREILDQHIATHKTCGLNGCTFSAHGKIVTLHINMQHKTGFADRINQLTSEEEIEKWKNERKKKFPTAENVARRQVEQAEKLARGELFEDKEFGKFKKSDPVRGRGKGMLSARGASTSIVQARRVQRTIKSHAHPGIIDPGYISFEDGATPKENHAKIRGRYFRGRGRGKWRGKQRAPVSDTATIRAGMMKFKGISDEAPITIKFVSPDGTTSENANDIGTLPLPTVPSCSGTITDSEGESHLPDGNKIAPIVVVEGNALSDSDAPMETSSKVVLEQAKPVLSLPSALAGLVAAYESSEIDECIKDSKDKGEAEQKPPASRRTHHGRFYEQRPARPPKPTLLEMLLAKEIRHERNVIFQCVRHIVSNNFFDPLN